MEISHLITFQLVAHILTDFFFQANEKAEDKNELGFKSPFLKWHLLISFTLSWLLSFQIKFVIGALVISLTHYIIDGIKKYINNHPKLGKSSFFIDQAQHILIIVIVVLLFDKYFGYNPIIDIKIDLKLLLVIFGYMLCLKPTNIFIKQTFKYFDIKLSEDDDLKNAGKLIGILERFLVLTFILLYQFEAVGFLIAAKSILRYKDDSTLKTEYVLIGTMLSFGIAIAIGIAITIMKLPPIF